MKQKIYLLLLILMISYIDIMADGWSQSTVVSSGGKMSSAGIFQNFNVIGQPVVDVKSDINFVNKVGFLFLHSELMLVTSEIVSGSVSPNNVSFRIKINNQSDVVINSSGMCWSESPNPTVDNANSKDETGSGDYEVTINGLKAHTLYFARPYAINAYRIFYGDEITFTTADTPPTAICNDVTVETVAGSCTTDASINDGSYDPDGDPITLVQEPPGPYTVGITNVTLTVKDNYGKLSNCSAKVTVKYSPATIYAYGALHTTGGGKNPTSKKTALELDLRVFDKSKISSCDPKNFGNIWDNTEELDNPGIVSITTKANVTFGGGPTYQYTITLPANDCISGSGYLVIGKATVDQTTVYVGSPTDVLAIGSTTNKYLQVVKNANGKIIPAATTPVPGSLLLLAEPAYIEFTSSEELFPVICESVDGEWDIKINLDPPEGFVSTPGSLSTDVTTSDMNAVQFIVKDIGSKWTHTKVTHKIKHKGKNSEVITKPEMIDKQPKKKDAEFNGTEDISGNSVEEEIAVRLKQNYPNPFAGLTELQYFVSKKEHATLVLTDLGGRVVANLVDRYVNGGWKTLIVNGSGLTAGVYILRLESLGKAAIMKIVKAD